LRLFVIADARPAAHLERGNEVQFINNMPPAIDYGPGAPGQAAPAPAPGAKAAAIAPPPAAKAAAVAAPARTP
jgi:rod shape-determining protein MreC